MARLLIQLDCGTEVSYPLDVDSVLIGRDLSNAIVIQHESASRMHAEITCNDGLYMIRDLQSVNGTTVNGTAVTEQVLRDGDHIVFGSVRCCFHEKSQTEESEPTKKEPESSTASGESENEKPKKSFAAHLAGFGKSVLDEGKRNALMTGLRAKIEKLRLVDLNQAHYALGDKCFKNGVLRDRFPSEFETIAALEQSIIQARAGVPVNETATVSEKFERSVSNVGLKTKAEVLALKLKQQLAEFGKSLSGIEDHEYLASEQAAVREVSNRIAALGAEYASLSSEHVSLQQLQSRLHSLPLGKIILLGGTLGVLWFLFSNALNKSVDDVTAVAHEAPVITSQGLYDFVEFALQEVYKQPIIDRHYFFVKSNNIKLHDIKINWRTPSPTNNPRDLKTLSINFTIYWEGPLEKDGFTRFDSLWDCEIERFTDFKILTSSGNVTRKEIETGVLNIGKNLLEKYINKKLSR